MSKFDKTCPQCAAANSAGAVQCACGYLFNPLYLEDPRLALELAIREEKLIEEYLTARAEQTVEAAKAAVHRADMDPENARKAVEAAIAQLDAEVAQAELAEQRTRAAEAEDKLEAHIAAVAQISEPADTITTEAGVQSAESWQAIIVAEALKATSMQAAVAQPLDSTPATPRTEPGAAFRAAQAAKAERAVKTAKDLETMKCPACGASISVVEATCRCGWSVSESLRERDAAARTRSAGERDVLTGHLETKKPTKSR